MSGTPSELVRAAESGDAATTKTFRTPIGTHDLAPPESSRWVALLGAFGWGTFAAALVPVVAIGLNWKRATATAATVAVIASLTINFGLKVTGAAMPFNIDVGAFSLAVSLTLFVGISLLSKPPRLDPDVEAVMDL